MKFQLSRSPKYTEATYLKTYYPTIVNSFHNTQNIIHAILGWRTLLKVYSKVYLGQLFFTVPCVRLAKCLPVGGNVQTVARTLAAKTGTSARESNKQQHKLDVALMRTAHANSIQYVWVCMGDCDRLCLRYT